MGDDALFIDDCQKYTIIRNSIYCMSEWVIKFNSLYGDSRQRG